MKLLIVDDHPMTCAGLQSLLQTFYPEATITQRHDAVGLAGALSEIDYVFLDMHLPHVDFRALLGTLAHCMHKVILISASPEPALLQLARAAGAPGFLPKNADVNAVLEGFQRILSGATVFDSIPAASKEDALTTRQREVLSALLRGLSNKQIALELDIAESTIKEHVTAILQASGARSRLELIMRHQNKPVV